jgi:NAD(P)-dependent dehydrogenase (short-subunit alcohol dehydrogenase family)/acyl carrier protein
MVRSDATYLVTGGLSGFGLATARWLADQGARHLVLVGRSGAATEEARSSLAAFEVEGVNVRVERADVTLEDSLRGVFDRMEREMPPLGGVIHAAMVLEDGNLASMPPDRFRAALAPKIEGAWNLHRLTCGRPLDFFVMYSSIASLVGVHGQSNYAAGNAFLEGLAEYRRGRGLPALAVEWGLIGGTGYAARNQQAVSVLANRFGVGSTPYGRALGFLGRLMGSETVNAAVFEVRWDVYTAEQSRFGLPFRFHKFALDRNTGAPVQDGRQLKELLGSTPPDEVLATLQGMALEEVSKVLRIQPSRIDCGRPLADLGLDSLMAVELQSSLETRFGVTLSSMRILDGMTTGQMAEFVGSALGVSNGSPQPAQVDSARIDVDAEVDAISDDRVDEILHALLRSGDA